MLTWFARRLRFNSTVLGLSLTVLVALLFWLDSAEESRKSFFFALLQRFELLASDMRFRVRGDLLPGPEVVIAAIDEKSIDRLGRWPWPYTTQAKLVNRLSAYGAAAIGYDVVFSAPDTSAGLENLHKIQLALTTLGYGDDLAVAATLREAIAGADHNQIFATALRASGRTVLGYFFHWHQDDAKHLSLEQKQRFWENIRGAEHFDVMPQSYVQNSGLRRAEAVVANIRVLSEAVCTADWCNGGFFNSVPDVDGVTRRYPLVAYAPAPLAATETAPSDRYRAAPVYTPLGVSVLKLVGLYTRVRLEPDRVARALAVRAATDEIYDIPVDHRGQMLINYLGPSELPPGHVLNRRFRFPRYAVADIISDDPMAIQEAPPEAFRGKIVLVGPTAIGVYDQRVTPVDRAFPGVETHATIIDNILHRRFLVAPWWGQWFTLASIVLVGILLVLCLPRLSALHGALVTALLMLGTMGLNYGLFITQGWQLSLVYPVLAAFVVWPGMTIYHFVIEQKQSRYLRKTFSTYLSPELVALMVRDGIEPRLGGSSGIRTAYFTDIQSFSSFSEVLSATQLVELLNEYLSAMTDLLVAEGGTLDKYEGDAIVAFFGAPIEQPDHAARAVRVALGMQQRLAQLRDKWRAEGDKWPELVHNMRMRIGISSGDIVVGNMGSAMRMDYTMTGDVVNTAARLEASAKQYGIYIQCTLETLRLAGPEDFEWRYIDKVKVVGKSVPIETVEIMAYKGELSPELEQMRALYHQGLELYRQQQWDEAIATFTESEKLEEVFPRRPTTPSRVYIERCEFFKAHPPEPDWDGSWTLTSK